ncbi:phage portal protein [Bradyrhizobium sp.]|uniref:phage portal protein n=2 Tax=Bradyrhizobium sp. TaxID=376 RepID=UPI003D1106A0
MSRAAMRQAMQNTRLNLLDRAIAAVSPRAGLQRYRDRLQWNVAMALSGAYTGASRSKRQFGDWKTTGGDADADTLFDLPLLRERARDLNRNNPLAAGAIHTKVGNVVGTGLALKSAIDADFLGLTEDQAEEWQRTTEREFNFWAESQDADVARTLNFYQQQELAFRSTLENGDAFALPVYVERTGSVYSLAVQLIEADRVCNERFMADSERIAGGVERDTSGAPVRYHILDQHPGAIRVNRAAATWTKVPAFNRSGRRNVLHLYRQLRIGQSRGVPDLAPVVSALKQLGDYTEAELTAAVVSGLFTVFIQANDPEGVFASKAAEALDAGNPYVVGEQSIKMGAGNVVALAPGEEINAPNPGRPNTAFDPFVQAILRQVGSALELPFELLVMHFSASYSASRAALLQAWKFFKARRFWLADNFCQPIYEAFMWEAVALGRIAAPGFLQDPIVRAAWLGSEWVGDAPGAIDPMKEAQAAGFMEDRGWKTGAENTAELTGGDWESKHRRLTRERRMRREAGLDKESVSERIRTEPTDPTPPGDDPAGDPNKSDNMAA